MLKRQAKKMATGRKSSVEARRTEIRRRLLEYLGRHRDELMMVWKVAFALEVGENTAKKLLDELVALGTLETGPASTTNLKKWRKQGIGYRLVDTETERKESRDEQ